MMMETEIISAIGHMEAVVRMASHVRTGNVLLNAL
jgi:hypothetical protein